MKRERDWIDVLDQVHGVEVTFPAELDQHAQRLMDALDVSVVIAPSVPDGEKASA